jgi:hypothetical protein
VNGDGIPVSAYFPQAKLGSVNYVYVWSGGMVFQDSGSPFANNNINYFGLSAVVGTYSYMATGGFYGALQSTPGLTIAQAALIDAKIDDGLPTTGNVTAMYVGSSVVYGAINLLTGGILGVPFTTAATPGTRYTCFDNNNMNGVQETYSISQNTGNLNCALSFKLQ